MDNLTAENTASNGLLFSKKRILITFILAEIASLAIGKAIGLDLFFAGSIGLIGMIAALYYHVYTSGKKVTRNNCTKEPP